MMTAAVRGKTRPDAEELIGEFRDMVTVVVPRESILEVCTFLRDDTLIDGYENHGDYVSGVSQAAQYAFEQGWILEEDIEGFTSLAGECVVGRAAASDITLDDLKACHNTGP